MSKALKLSMIAGSALVLGFAFQHLRLVKASPVQKVGIAAASETPAKESNLRPDGRRLVKRIGSSLIPASQPKSLITTDGTEAGSESSLTTAERSEKENEALKITEKYLFSQAYSEMSSDDVNTFLTQLSLGEGKDFENTRREHLTTVTERHSKDPKSTNFLSNLQGSFQSEFTDSTPNAQEESYSINLDFEGNTLTVSFVLGGKAYYLHKVTDLSGVQMAKADGVPPNLLIELPAKVENGYLHPMFLEILVGSDNKNLLGVLYNTDQTKSDTTNYLHAENLIFRKH